MNQRLLPYRYLNILKKVSQDHKINWALIHHDISWLLLTLNSVF